MRTLWAASFNHLLRRPAQAALAFVGLALGVATITAVDIAVVSAGRAFELSMDAVNGSVTHQITGGPNGIDERLYAAMRMGGAISGLSVDMAPVVEGYVAVGADALQLFGIDPLVDAKVRGRDAASLQTAGSTIARMRNWFTERGTVVVAADTARRLGISVGATFQIDVGGHRHPAQLLAQFDAPGPGYDALILTDIAQAQEWLGSQGKLSRIDLRIPSGAAGEAALTRLRAKLAPGLQLREAPRRAQQNLSMTNAFTVNLQAMSLLALLVGLLLIYSAISFSVIQRRRTFGVLRALGATRANVLTLVLAEATAVGIVGAALGIALGLAIGRHLVALVSSTINDLYFVLAVNEVVLPASTIVKAVAAGLIVTLAAAVAPAMEVANSNPQLALRRSALERRAVNVAHRLLLVGLLCAAASGLVVVLSRRSLLAGFIALLLLLIAVAAFTPAALRMCSTIAARLAGRASPIARLAFGEVAASLSRTGVAVAALGIAVAAMIGVSIMVESFRESLRAWLDRTLAADLYITAPGPGFARPERRLDPRVIDALLRVPGVTDHSESRRGVVESARGPITVDALRLASKGYSAIQLTEGEAARVWPAFESGSIVISEPLAWKLRLARGDELTLLTVAGPRAFPVAGVYREYGNDRGIILMHRGVYSHWWRDEAVTSLGLYLERGSDVARITAALNGTLAGISPQARQAIHIRSNAEIRSLSMQIFERTFVITRVLYWLAAGVAAIGLISALLAWELERSRELAVLRALGLTARGAGMLIELQTGFMGLATFVTAVPTGLLTALILIEVINRRAFGWQIDLHLAGTQFGSALFLALATALVAGLYPAWRTARAPIAARVREE